LSGQFSQRSLFAAVDANLCAIFASRTRTSSHAELLKGYMVRERLGTPALTCGNIFP